MHPTKPSLERSNAVLAEFFPITGQVHSDLPGLFICTLVSGMKHHMVVYDYNSNNIIVETMKSLTAAEHTRVYKIIFDHLTSRGFRPQLQKLDNEASTMLKVFLTEKGVGFQLTPA